MVQIPINKASSFGLIALRSIIMDGRLSVVTAIIKAKIVPSCAPLWSRASATGIVPKISAYMGTPTMKRFVKCFFELLTQALVSAVGNGAGKRAQNAPVDI